ncbi:DnaB-like helicase N-terminal domain-containing protein [Streptomyces sp. NPDC051561]|uniref:DnaB-like helicase N-terminal domain-containing protein n=1 Tax=Streptomyces sp. NPDC051561 TaxID=3365658 RepID=UPI00378E763C
MTDPGVDTSAYGPIAPELDAGHHAERALLGALFLDPVALDRADKLAPEHFAHHAHRALFAAIRRLTPPARELHCREPVWINMVLADASQHIRGITPSHLFMMVDDCPEPRHAPAYAQIVWAGHVRRSLHTHAEQLAQAASDTKHPSPVIQVIKRCSLLADQLAVLAAQFGQQPGSLPRTSVTDPPSAASPEALDDERALLAGAVSRPQSLHGLGWLQPSDFAHPVHSRLYECLVSLARRGETIDPVTVLWEAQQRGLIDDELSAPALLDVLRQPVGSPEYWAEQVVQQALLGTALVTAHRIGAYTLDPATTPGQLITGTRRALADVQAIHRRWQRARRPPRARAATTAQELARPSRPPPQRALR